jgi:hypothetical protein
MDGARGPAVLAQDARDLVGATLGPREDEDLAAIHGLRAKTFMLIVHKDDHIHRHGQSVEEWVGGDKNGRTFSKISYIFRRLSNSSTTMTVCFTF